MHFSVKSRCCLAALACGAAFTTVVILRRRRLKRKQELTGRRAIVVGAGVSGLTAAASLRRQGFSVTVLDANDEVGGLSATSNTSGYVFNEGALFIAGISVFDHIFARLGAQRTELLPTHTIQCALRVVLPGRTVVTIGPGTSVRVFRPAATKSMAAAMANGLELDEAASTRGSAELAALVARWLPLTRVLEATLLQPLSTLAILHAGAWRHIALLAGAGSLADVAASAFTDEEVSAAVGSSLLYQGAPPQEQPAANIVAVVMMCADGFHVPVGGMGAVGHALRGLCEGPITASLTAGPPVSFRLGCAVPPGGIEVCDGRVTGVWCRDGRAGKPEFLRADAVIVSASGLVVFGTGTELRGLVAAAHVPRAMRAHTARALQHLSHTMFSVHLGLRVSPQAGRSSNASEAIYFYTNPRACHRLFPQERPACLSDATIHYHVPLLPGQAALFSAARYEDPIENVSFICTTEVRVCLPFSGTRGYLSRFAYGFVPNKGLRCRRPPSSHRTVAASWSALPSCARRPLA